MEEHLNQALHNGSFVLDLIKQYPDSYFDWKVTATFYTALHLLRAFCKVRGVDPGDSHSAIENNFNPRRCARPITACPPFVWKNYSKLQRYSEHARYEVFLDAEVENEIQRDNFKDCQKLIHELKGYFNTQGVPCLAA
jgi:hypothetical protein